MLNSETRLYSKQSPGITDIATYSEAGLPLLHFSLNLLHFATSGMACRAVDVVDLLLVA